MAEDKNGKKQIPLRLSSGLYSQLMAWAEEDFRSVNGQIEYLLSECVRKRRKMPKTAAGETDGPSDSGQ